MRAADWTEFEGGVTGLFQRHVAPSGASKSGNRSPSEATPSSQGATVSQPRAERRSLPERDAPLAVAPLAVAPLAVAPLAVAPLAVAPLAVAPLAVAPRCLRPVNVSHVYCLRCSRLRTTADPAGTCCLQAALWLKAASPLIGSWLSLREMVISSRRDVPPGVLQLPVETLSVWKRRDQRLQRGQQDPSKRATCWSSISGAFCMMRSVTKVAQDPTVSTVTGQEGEESLSSR
ncbi:hypothetical protein EYF80_057895 [Liparis tanakae]|uniref:Uncharacterized protein n=1 Tax=Liparis tanakae TaxID=230148 RepID=A0A4Z2ESW9_9TELE|nr:hypothetical protein EYF80_057895 [Liparis tanakae]